MDGLNKKKFEVRPLMNAITVIALMLVIGVCFVVYTYNTFLNESKAYVGEINELSASNTAKKLSSNIHYLESFAAYISSVEIKDDTDAVNMLRDELRMSGEGMLRVSYTQNDGSGLTVRDNGTVNRLDLSDMDYFRRAMEGETFITKTRIDVVTRMPVNIYAVPIKKDDKIIGANMGICHAPDLEEVVKEDYLDGNAFSFIINSDVERVIDGSYTDADNYAPFADINMTEEMLGQIKASISAHKDGGALLAANAEGAKYWVSYYPIGLNDWYLMLAIPYNYIVKNAVSALYVSLLVLIVALVGAVAFVKYLNHVKTSNREEVYKYMYFDSLTGLYSKNGFVLKAPEFLQNPLKKYAVVLVDIDNFRMINELFGYDTGSNILKHMGDLIREDISVDEMAGRSAGDDFICLLHWESAEKMEKRIGHFINRVNFCKFDEENTNFNIVVHIGVYKLDDPQEGQMEEYIDRAKMSILSLKDKHYSAYAFYDEELQQRMHFDAELENDVDEALKNKDFKVYIQPKYNAKTHELAGGEALIRWQHKTKGFLTPNKFVDVFERNGVITDIDMYVYDTVCRMQSKWLAEGYEPVPISVNQSRLHLYHSDYIETLRHFLDKYNLPARYVELEITENIALSSSDVLDEAVKHIHSLGFKVSMDDFGSGESSLNILKDIDIDILKLDRMFFLETENNNKAKQIIKSVIDMANRLNISTVAEGVENEEQLKFLQDAGCDLIQGYLFGKPMPYEEFEKLFKENAKRNNDNKTEE